MPAAVRFRLPRIRPGIRPGHDRKVARCLTFLARGAGTVTTPAAGTGVVTKALLEALPESEITATDLNPPMLEEAARRIRVPTLLVRGVNSDVVSEEGAQHLLTLIPGSTLVDVSDAGHMVAGDKNDPFSAGVIAFLEKHIPLS